MDTSPTVLVQDQFHDPFPAYPERRVFRVRLMEAPDLLAECSKVEHDGYLWRMVRISSDDGNLYEGHVKVAQTTFFPKDVELVLEGNATTGRLRISQKLTPIEPEGSLETGDSFESEDPIEAEDPIET